MSIYIDSHRAVLKQVGDIFLDTHSALPNHHLNHLNHFNPSDGDGYSELYDFGKLCVGKGKYWLDHPLKISAETPAHAFGITILLSGNHRIRNHQSNVEYQLNSPMIILRKGRLGLQTIYLQQQKQMSLITLDFNEKLLNMIESNHETHDLAKFFFESDGDPLKTIDIPNKDILHQAHYLLNLPPAQTSIDLLHMEGAALELVSLLLHHKTENDLIPTFVKNAILILENQFDHKITIRDLSKQVGINECDLKRLFKQHTGQTIGCYLLNIRMRHAQILLKEGITIDKVAEKTGYSNQHYFKQIFERYFGYGL